MRIVLRFLVMVMLLTVLSPKFGWESASAAEAHVHAAAVAHESVEGDCHEHLAVEDVTLADDMGDHHCCPGHVLSHLLGGVGFSTDFPALGKASALPGSRAVVFSSRVPEGLERPPRSAA